MKRITVCFLVLLMIIAFTASAQLIRFYTTDAVEMTAPGTSAAIYIGNKYDKLMWYFSVATINTSISTALQQKSGDSEWTNVWADSLVYEANGNYGFEWFGVGLADSVRFRWIAEEAGTDAVLTHNAVLIGGN